MSLRSIKIALETRLNAIASPLPTQWENIAFSPPSTIYQRVNFLTAPPENPCFGSTMHRKVGYMQVTLMSPINGGGGPAYTKANDIEAWFPRGSSYISGGITVMIVRTPAIGPGIVEADRFVLPISIRWFANIA